MVQSRSTNGHELGPEAFVHLDVLSAFSKLQSPSTPHEYVSALAQQFPLNERTADQAPALAICDWGLQSAVKTAVACQRAGVHHLLGLPAAPLALAGTYSDAGYFARNVRTIDLGHGMCTYRCFEQCPHRLACARCDFYVPKSSTRAQLLEAKGNLQRMLSKITLTDGERAAVTMAPVR